MDCNIEPRSLFQVNVSGGEPREVQFKLSEDPKRIVTVDDDGVFITGEAVWRDKRCLNDGL